MGESIHPPVALSLRFWLRYRLTCPTDPVDQHVRDRCAQPDDICLLCRHQGRPPFFLDALHLCTRDLGPQGWPRRLWMLRGPSHHPACASRCQARRRDRGHVPRLDRNRYVCSLHPAVLETPINIDGARLMLILGPRSSCDVPIGGLLPGSTTLPPALALKELVGSSLVSSMSSYDLDLSVLVKGSRGSGKRTVVRSVAASSGLGVMEVSPTVTPPSTCLIADPTSRAPSPDQLLRRHRRDRREDGGCPSSEI